MAEVHNMDALDLWDAALLGSSLRVEALLASGVNPNARFDALRSPLSGVAEDWTSPDKSAHPPIVYFDPTRAPALFCAAQGGKVRDPGLKSRLTRIMTGLLQHGANPYALFRQPIHVYHGLPLFPGEAADAEFDREDTDLLMEVSMVRTVVLRKELEFEEFRRQGKPVPEWDDSDYESDGDYDMALDFTPQYPRRYGAYSVTHALLEQGRFIRPILDLGEALDLERRDPQGRTMFLAACRSGLGLDASIDADCNTLAGDLTFDALIENPFPQRDNPWTGSERHDHTFETKVCSGPTLLEFFVSRGANLLAVDLYGRNALHQIFTSFQSSNRTRPPVNNAAVKYLVSNCPSLVNQPDHAGFYPLHFAIRRIGFYRVSANNVAPMAIYHLEIAIVDLLAAGADPLACDARGNTVLHYLAASRLGKDDRSGDEQRRLFRVFLDRGVDATARNSASASALELFFSTADPIDIQDSNDLERYEEIGREVVGEFERAGCSLSETNPAGQTLLHLVAALKSVRAFPWFRVLQAKGLDPMARDTKGTTPMDLAGENEELRKHYSALKPG